MNLCQDCGTECRDDELVEVPLLTTTDWGCPHCGGKVEAALVIEPAPPLGVAGAVRDSGMPRYWLNVDDMGGATQIAAPTLRDDTVARMPPVSDAQARRIVNHLQAVMGHPASANKRW